MRAAIKWLRTRLRSLLERLAKHRAELLTAAAFVCGWLLVTWSVASFVKVWQVWPASIGCLAISCGGWKLLGTMAREGLYTLTRKGK